MKKISYLFFLIVVVSCSEQTQEERLPILGRSEVVDKDVNGEIVQDTIFHTITDFKFVDQDSNWVTNNTFKDKIYVADFFFTTCPTICPVMKKEMLRVYEKFEDNEEVAILSHTIDPEHDNVEVLKDFADRLDVQTEKWHFVTGKKEDIYAIGQKSYMVTAMEDQAAPGGFIHSGAFILVDKNGRIRGLYDGTVPEQVDKLMADIPKLLAEYRHDS
jgi:protein SCO1/2